MAGVDLGGTAINYTLVEARVDGDSIVGLSAPVVSPAAVRVYVTDAEGMQARGGAAITGFTPSRAHGDFVPAEAKVDGNTIGA